MNSVVSMVQSGLNFFPICHKEKITVIILIFQCCILYKTFKLYMTMCINEFIVHGIEVFLPSLSQDFIAKNLKSFKILPKFVTFAYFRAEFFH
jgi:hypothetical protein